MVKTWKVIWFFPNFATNSDKWIVFFFIHFECIHFLFFFYCFCLFQIFGFPIWMKCTTICIQFVSKWIRDREFVITEKWFNYTILTKFQFICELHIFIAIETAWTIANGNEQLGKRTIEMDEKGTHTHGGSKRETWCWANGREQNCKRKRNTIIRQTNGKVFIGKKMSSE